MLDFFFPSLYKQKERRVHVRLAACIRGPAGGSAISQRTKTRSFRAPRFLAHRHTLVTRASVTLFGDHLPCPRSFHRSDRIRRRRLPAAATILSSRTSPKKRNSPRMSKGEERASRKGISRPPRDISGSNGAGWQLTGCSLLAPERVEDMYIHACLRVRN